MDRTEKPKKRRRFANHGEVSEWDAAALPGSTGRETSNTDEKDVIGSVDAHRRSEVTGRHDAGSGANETTDGLTASEEALRRGAEDTPTGTPEEELEDLPVFDRADALWKK
jgi:hypothetical protein